MALGHKFFFWLLVLPAFSLLSDWFFNKMMLSDGIVGDEKILAYIASVLIVDVAIAFMIAVCARTHRILLGFSAAVASLVLEYRIMLFVILAVVFSKGT